MAKGKPCVSCGDPRTGGIVCDRHGMPVCGGCACPECSYVTQAVLPWESDPEWKAQVAAYLAASKQAGA